MSTAPCPICKKPSPPKSENSAFPFCSRRCRSVDLGRWLGEEYRMPDRQSEQSEDELPSGSHPDRQGEDA